MLAVSVPTLAVPILAISAHRKEIVFPEKVTKMKNKSTSSTPQLVINEIIRLKTIRDCCDVTVQDHKSHPESGPAIPCT